MTAMPTQADIYRWADANGQVHFSDRSAVGASKITPSQPSTFAPPATDLVAHARTAITFEYYYAYPHSRRDLQRALFEVTPIREEGKPYLGNTHSTLHYHYETRMEGALCRVSKADTELDITYTMPRLGNETSISADTADSFNRYYPRLMLHETGHADIGRAAARDLESALYAMPATAQCSDLAPAANQLFQNILTKAQQANKDYDARTNHGKTQGASIQDYI